MRILLILFLSGFSLSTFAQERPFITTWKTDNVGGSCDSCIEIPTEGLGYFYEVDWDMDGVYDDTGLTSSTTHDFGTPGTYTIAIRGAFPSISFQSQSDAKKILSIDQWGDIQWKAFDRAFLGCTNLDIEASDVPDLSEVGDVSYMFAFASNLSKGLENWDVSFVKDMSGMFSEASSFDGDLSSWDVSSVEDMSYMFTGARSIIGSFKRWDVSSVINMTSMFEGANSFNGDISRWDVSSVEDMSGMFDSATSFDGDLSTWDVSSVSYLWGTFAGASTFNQDLSNWDVSSVVNMQFMFVSASSFNQDLSNWDVSTVASMEFMFGDAISFNQSLSTWDLSSSMNINDMLSNCGMDIKTYESTLEGWGSNLSTPDDLILGSENLEYCDVTARNLLLDKGWTIERDIQADEEDCLTATKDLTLEKDLYLYPIPAHNELHIANLYVAGSYKLYDRLGKLVSEGEYQPSKAININHLTEGIFYLVVETEDNRYPFVLTKVQ